MVKHTARNGFLLYVALGLLSGRGIDCNGGPAGLARGDRSAQGVGPRPILHQVSQRHGLPVVGSSKVSDYALREAAYLADKLLDHRPEVRDAMIRNKVRLAVMAYSERTTDIPEHRDLQPKSYWNIRAVWEPAASGRPSVAPRRTCSILRATRIRRKTL